MYFVHFRSAARFAAAPVIIKVSFRCESANVTGTITSQACSFPCDHEMSVAPSGRFPSVIIIISIISIIIIYFFIFSPLSTKPEA